MPEDTRAFIENYYRNLARPSVADDPADEKHMQRYEEWNRMLLDAGL